MNGFMKSLLKRALRVDESSEQFKRNQMMFDFAVFAKAAVRVMLKTNVEMRKIMKEVSEKIKEFLNGIPPLLKHQAWRQMVLKF